MSRRTPAPDDRGHARRRTPEPDGQAHPRRIVGTRRLRILPVLCLGLLILAAVPTALSTVGPADRHVERHDPRYVSQTGSLAGTRRQAVLNDNEDALDHALETCGAAGVQGLAARFQMAPDIPRLAARYARDFEVSARAARRTGCAVGLREGG